MGVEEKPRWLPWLTGAVGAVFLLLFLVAVERPRVHVDRPATDGAAQVVVSQPRAAIDRPATDVLAQVQSRPIPDIPPGFFAERRRRLDREALAYAQLVQRVRQAYVQNHTALTIMPTTMTNCMPADARPIRDQSGQLARHWNIASCTVWLNERRAVVQVVYVGGNDTLVTTGN